MDKTPPDSLRHPLADTPDRQDDRRVDRSSRPVRLLAAVAGLLALFGLGTLAAVLVLALLGQAVAPWLVGCAYFALPLAFLLMAALVIDGIRRRRRS